MKNNNTILCFPIYCQDDSQIKKELQKKLSAYSKRLIENCCNPIVNIRFDTLDTQREKQVLLKFHTMMLLQPALKNH